MKMMSGDLIKHEGILTCNSRELSFEDAEIELLKRILRVGEIETKWMEGWYAESKSSFTADIGRGDGKPVFCSDRWIRARFLIQIDNSMMVKD